MKTVSHNFLMAERFAYFEPEWQPQESHQFARSRFTFRKPTSKFLLYKSHSYPTLCDTDAAGRRGRFLLVFDEAVRSGSVGFGSLKCMVSVVMFGRRGACYSFSIYIYFM